MLTRGRYRDKDGEYDVLLSHTKHEVEVILAVSGKVSSAYKSSNGEEYSYINKKAKELWKIIFTGLKLCTVKNGVAVQFIYGTSIRHEFKKSKIDYSIETFNGSVCGVTVSGENIEINLEFTENNSLIPHGIPYIKLSNPNTKKVDDFEQLNDDDVYVRSVEEIALEKEDITWLKNKKYYIVNDDETAEKIFNYLDNYNGVISYDTETTGLKINMFGKINSIYKRELEQWNETHPDQQIRADRLVGVIFCVEPDVSYYFPVANRKFKNLYESGDMRNKIIKNIKSKYTIGELRDRTGDMADYIRNTPEEDWTSDIILMERIRNILETKHIIAHNGTFEWKVGHLYDIDTNIKDDTMVLHQIMYKFRSTTSNSGEPSNLKYLSKVELGMDQWELSDFFPDYKNDDSGSVRVSKTTKYKKGKKSNRIDFSYMTYEGARIYAPADGDATYQLFMKYKQDLVHNHKEQEYIYNVEVLVSMAIGYMEFYGHRLDEAKIEDVRVSTKAKMTLIESEIRQLIKYSSPDELRYYAELKGVMDEQSKYSHEQIIELTDKLKGSINNNTEYVLNLASPAQVAKLFYDDLGIPFSGDKKSVAKKEVKSLLKAKNEDGTVKYPVVHLYAEYKKLDTLLTKFFDNLQNFMYPGGFIFSSYGQISTATGRMNCSKPNAQQYPKDITNIVIPRQDCVMIDADYSQIEYRVLVALAGEEKLAKLFEDPDNDYHTLMASLMYGVPYASVTPKMRSDAKSFNFGIPYGMGFKSLAILLTGMSGPSQVEEAKVKYELYFKDQPKVRKFFDQVKEMALVNKFTRTFWNRYRYYSFEDKDGTMNNNKKAAALRQAGNAVIQGTAADIFKISVARNFLYIRNNKLFGLLYIVNMIHDEQLFEANAKFLNIQRVLHDLGKNMQFNVNGFPPLYIGAGVGPSWAKAKGKMTEIHPHLLDILSEEVKDASLFKSTLQNKGYTEDIYKYFNDRIYNFRRDTIKNYLLDPNNHGKDLHPAIGNLLNLQFTYGNEKGDLKDDEFTMLCLREFIKNNDLNLSESLFKAQAESITNDVEEDTEYDEAHDNDDIDDSIIETDFALVDESDSVYGSTIHDLIKIFGFVVSKTKRLCGVDIRNLSYKQKDDLADLIEDHICEADEPDSMQVVFLQDSNILNYTGLWVKGIDGSELEKRIKLLN